MKLMLSLALIAALAGVPMMASPALAGGFYFDLPNLTWPEGPVLPPSDGSVVVATKSGTKG